MSEKSWTPRGRHQFVVIPACINRIPERELSGNAKRVYSQLLDYAGDRGVAWPSVETLAEDLGLCVRTVKAAIAALVAFPLIRRELRNNGLARQSSVYTFVEHHIFEGEKRLAEKPEDEEAKCKVFQGKVQTLSRQSANSAPNPELKNQSVSLSEKQEPPPPTRAREAAAVDGLTPKTVPISSYQRPKATLSPEQRVWIQKYWEEHPKAQDMALTKEAFVEKIQTQEDFNHLMSQLAKHKMYWNTLDARYIPSSHAYLRRNRFKDVIQRVAVNERPYW